MTPLSLHCPLGFLSTAEEYEYTPHRNGGKNGICCRSHDPFYYNSNPQPIILRRYLIGRIQYTDLGYSGCDSTEPALPLQISSSVAKEHEYTAHGMWIMAEISGRSHCLYLLPDSKLLGSFQEFIAMHINCLIELLKLEIYSQFIFVNLFLFFVIRPH